MSNKIKDDRINLDENKAAKDFQIEHVNWHKAVYGEDITCDVREWKPGCFMAINIRPAR